MSNVISLRHLSRTVLVAFCGVLLFAAAAQAKTKLPPETTWNLASEFGLQAKQNPAKDKYRDKAVWSYMYGEADAPSSYSLMKYRISPKKVEKACGPYDFYEWNTLLSTTGTPTIYYNAGPEQSNRCAPYARFPAQTAFMHPEAGGGTLNAVVGWKSPITGTVTLSGSIESTDHYVEGISWQLDQGSTILSGPTEQADNNPTSFGPIEISVTAGESVYLDVGPKLGTLGRFDTTAVSLTIASP